MTQPSKSQTPDWLTLIGYLFFGSLLCNQLFFFWIPFPGGVLSGAFMIIVLFLAIAEPTCPIKK